MRILPQTSFVATQGAEEQAKKAQAWQRQQEQLQQELAASTQAVATASDGVRFAVDALQATQDRTTAALGRLLGASFAWADAVFYGGCLLAIGAPATGCHAPST